MVGTLLSPDLAPMVISGQATQFKKKKNYHRSSFLWWRLLKTQANSLDKLCCCFFLIIQLFIEHLFVANVLDRQRSYSHAQK